MKWLVYFTHLVSGSLEHKFPDFKFSTFYNLLSTQRGNKDRRTQPSELWVGFLPWASAWGWPLLGTACWDRKWLAKAEFINLPLWPIFPPDFSISVNHHVPVIKGGKHSHPRFLSHLLMPTQHSCNEYVKQHRSQMEHLVHLPRASHSAPGGSCHSCSSQTGCWEGPPRDVHVLVPAACD